MSEKNANTKEVVILVVACLAIALLGGLYWLAQMESSEIENDNRTVLSTGDGPESKKKSGKSKAVDSVVARRAERETDPRLYKYGPVVFWWDNVPEAVQEVTLESGPQSNMHYDDYVGPQACAECHKEQHSQWLGHSHRRMNALATKENVEGNFDNGSIEYLGGLAQFVTKEGAYRMVLTRDDTKIVYDVRQTIGSRFFQYYVGRMIEGPFSDDSPYCTTNHVLPFGYWLERKQWTPVVHVGPELPDGQRDDPFSPRSDPQEGETFLPYASNCSMCHTTFPLADDLTRKPRVMSKHAPMQMHWDMAGYFKKHHPELWGQLEHPADATTEQIESMPTALMDYEADEHAVTLGISCEACHLGAQEHAKDPSKLPDFHPHSPFLRLYTETGELETGRAQQNVNWACGRCHVGGRPQFAAGMSTWNSVEYTDAMLGSCYSELRCIDCHAPHEGIGPKWTATAMEDDARCIKCHPQFNHESELTAHTHHAAGSAGSRCMNCHMPHLNEGLQDVVRTHMIYSPTNKAMIEENHPNACNLCHLDQPIDWTLKHLQEWYNGEFDSDKIAKNYPDRNEAVGRGWLKSDHESVRLVAAAAVTRQKEKKLLPELVEALDDPYLLNRQFALRGLKQVTGVDAENAGYRFYMTPRERKDPIAKVLAEIVSQPKDAPDANDAPAPNVEKEQDAAAD